MRHYETVIVLRPDLVETQLKDTLKRFEGVIAAGDGHLLLTEDWGMREMAYRIHREQRGLYFRLDYVAATATVNELERTLKLSDVVLRYLSVVVDAKPDVTKLKEEAQARAQAQAAAAQAPPAAVASQQSSAQVQPEPEAAQSSGPSEGGVEQN